MHPREAEALEELAGSSQDLDAEITRLRSNATHPKQNGWGTSLRAVTTLPFLGAGAVVIDALDMLIRRTSDRVWD